MKDNQRDKFNRFLYYILLFVGIGIDLAVDFCYSFTFLAVSFGRFFLLRKDSDKDLTSTFVILMMIIGPFIAGVLISIIKSFLNNI